MPRCSRGNKTCSISYLGIGSCRHHFPRGAKCSSEDAIPGLHKQRDYVGRLSSSRFRNMSSRIMADLCILFQSHLFLYPHECYYRNPTLHGRRWTHHDNYNSLSSLDFSVARGKCDKRQLVLFEYWPGPQKLKSRSNESVKNISLKLMKRRRRYTHEGRPEP